MWNTHRRRKIMGRKSVSAEEIMNKIGMLLQDKNQVWVRVKPRKSHPHWSRARVEELRGDKILIKPIKHGGRLELVSASDVNLWFSMNSAQAKRML
jgi:hypothetical protein